VNILTEGVENMPSGIVGPNDPESAYQSTYGVGPKGDKGDPGDQGEPGEQGPPADLTDIQTDVEIVDGRLILRSPNDSRWSITVDNSGVITAAPVT
jgi:hypothetical protein